MKGHFKTAYLQREVPLDIIVTTDADLEVGDVVTLKDAKYNGPDGVIDVKMPVKVADNTKPAVGHYIVAQSDMTLRSGSVGYDANDIYAYYYHDVVKTLGNAALITTNANSTNYDVAYANGTNSANTDYLLYSASTAAKDKGAKRGAFYKVTNVDDVWYD